MKRKSRELIALLALLLCLFGTVNALSIESNTGVYSKGETIQIFGGCDAGIAVSISSIGREISEENVRCINSGFDLNYLIGFSDPAGVWELKVTGETEDSITVKVNQARESKFYLVTFLSPSAETHPRGDEINISVRITDTGKPVETENVFTWFPNGRKQRLSPVGEGVYSIGYKIPLDEKLGMWKIYVTVEKETEQGIYGGENSAGTEIGTAPVLIEIIEPKARQFGAGSTVPLQIRANYEGGELPEQMTASVNDGINNFEMESQGGGIFTLNLKTEIGDIGIKRIRFTATDQYGNEGVSAIEITFAEDIIPVVLSVLPYIAVALVILLGIYYRVLPKLRERKSGKQLSKRRKELKKEMEELQKKYFNKGGISKESYDKKIAAMNSELNETEEKLKKG